MQEKESLVENARSRILSNALTLFCQKGYDGTGISEICELSDVTKPTLYYYFTNKDGLYQAIWTEYYERLIPSLQKATVYNADQENYDKDVFPVLSKVAKTFFDFAQKNKEIYFHALSVIQMPQEIQSAKIVFSYYERIYKILQTMFINMGKAHGGIKGRDFQLSITFLGIVNSYLTCWKLNNESLNKKSVESLVRQFMHGIFS